MKEYQGRLADAESRELMWKGEYQKKVREYDAVMGLLE